MATLASDTFVRANENPLGNSVWSVVTGADGDLKIVSNTVNSTADGGSCVAAYTGVAFPNDQWSQIVLVAGSNGTTYMGPVVRQSTAAVTGYWALVQGPYDGGTHNIYLVKRIANAQTVLASTTTTTSVGDVFYLEVQGTSLVVKKNGTTIAALSSTNADIASGKAGAFLLQTGSPTDGFNNFAAGDFVSTATAITAVTVNSGTSPTVLVPFNVGITLDAATAGSTNFAITVGAGTGSLGGTTTCTIGAGLSSGTVVGATYSVSESGVVLHAARTSGDTVAAADSSSFTVNPASSGGSATSGFGNQQQVMRKKRRSGM